MKRTALLIVAILAIGCANKEHEQRIADLERRVKATEDEQARTRNALAEIVTATQNIATGVGNSGRIVNAIAAEVAALAGKPVPVPASAPQSAIAPSIAEPQRAEETQRRAPTTDGGIISFCTAKWGTKYDMIEYCEKEQQTAKDAVEKRGWSAPINHAVFAGIARDCNAKWRADWSMRDYCEKEQITAYQAINNH